MMMIKTTIIPTKIAWRVVLSAVLMDISADAQVAGAAGLVAGAAGLVAGAAGQVAGVAGHVEGCCVTITPV